MGTRNRPATRPDATAVRRKPRRWLAAALLSLGALLSWLGVAPKPDPAPAPEVRVPISEPVLEPDRPDLIGEPRIAAPPEVRQRRTAERVRDETVE